VPKRPPASLQPTLWDLQKRWGDQIIAPLSEVTRVAARPMVATGFTALDQVLSRSGLPVDALTLCESSGTTTGATTFALMTLGQAQGADGLGGVIDLAQTFDPAYAVRCGVALDRLVIVRPENAASALAISADLLQTRLISLILFDSLALEQGFRPDMGSIRQLHTHLRGSGSVLIWLALAAALNWESMVDTRLCFERMHWLEEDDDIQGYRVQVQLTRQDGRECQRMVHFDLDFESLLKGDST
jgi:hypothetical protein